MTEEGRVREVKNELLSYYDSMEFANFVKKNLHLAKNSDTQNMIDHAKIEFTDTSDNYLQRAINRLEESGSNSAMRLFGYIILELISRTRS